MHTRKQGYIPSAWPRILFRLWRWRASKKTAFTIICNQKNVYKDVHRLLGGSSSKKAYDLGFQFYRWWVWYSFFFL